MPLNVQRRSRARAANAPRPAPPFFDVSPVRRVRINNFELFFFNDLDWVEKIRGYEKLFRFHRAAELQELIADLEWEYRNYGDEE